MPSPSQIRTERILHLVELCEKESTKKRKTVQNWLPSFIDFHSGRLYPTISLRTRKEYRFAVIYLLLHNKDNIKDGN
ncbi:unnamed protein product [marine sediment metagenome]|uniref:Uncharacterized protein n=1 Tax=marine sediment metagenome TaxID=412755 RepID=X1C015_9ZZZZ